MIFTLNKFAVSSKDRLYSKGPKTMNTLRCLLFAAIVVVSSATLALGGDIQGPGRNEPPPPPPASQSITESAEPTSTDEIQIAWQDLSTKMLLEILLTIY